MLVNESTMKKYPCVLVLVWSQHPFLAIYGPFCNNYPNNNLLFDSLTICKLFAYLVNVHDWLQ